MSSNLDKESFDRLVIALHDPEKRALIIKGLQSHGDFKSKKKTPRLDSPLRTIQASCQRPRFDSPTTIQRNRALLASSSMPRSTTSSSSGSSSNVVGPKLPLEELLNDVIGYVEFFHAGKDHSEKIKNKMQKMGAIIRDQFTRDVTHVIFKDGSFNTYRKAKLLNVHMLSVLWLEACCKNSARVSERNYPALSEQASDEDISMLSSQVTKDFDKIVRDEKTRKTLSPLTKTNKVSTQQKRKTMLLTSCSSDSYQTAMGSTSSKSPIDEMEETTINETPELTSDDSSDCGVVNGEGFAKLRRTLLTQSPSMTDDSSVLSSLLNASLAKSQQSDESQSMISCRKKTRKTISRNRSDMDLTNIAETSDGKENRFPTLSTLIRPSATNSTKQSKSKQSIETDSDRTVSDLLNDKTSTTMSSLRISSESHLRNATNENNRNLTGTTMSSLRISTDSLKTCLNRNQPLVVIEDVQKNLDLTGSVLSDNVVATPKKGVQIRRQSVRLEKRREEKSSSSGQLEEMNKSDRSSLNLELGSGINTHVTIRKNRGKPKIDSESEVETSSSKIQAGRFSSLKKKTTTKTALSSSFKDSDSDKEENQNNNLSKKTPIARKMVKSSENQKNKIQKDLLTYSEVNRNRVSTLKKQSTESSSTDSDSDIQPNLTPILEKKKKTPIVRKAMTSVKKQPKQNPLESIQNESLSSRKRRKLFDPDDTDAYLFSASETEAAHPEAHTFIDPNNCPNLNKRGNLPSQSAITLFPRKRPTKAKTPADSKNSRSKQLHSPAPQPESDSESNSSYSSLLNSDTFQSSDELIRRPKKKRALPSPTPSSASYDSERDAQPELLSFVEKRTRQSQRLLGTPRPRYTQSSTTSTRSSELLPITPLKRRSTLDFVSMTASQRQRKLKLDRKRQVSIVCTKFHTDQTIEFEAIVMELGRFFVEENVTSATTHLVTTEAKRTINMLKGIARGCWILRHQWLIDSRRQGRWLPEEDYELIDFSPAVQQCRLERQAFGSDYSMDLFKNCGSIMVAPRGTTPKPKDLKDLITICQGTLTSSELNAKYSIGQYVSRDDVISVTEKWILDSINFNKLMKTSKYLIQQPLRPLSPCY